ncbi:hypothetical protein C2845_PM17G09280 [Panicum miliaceum]|uniref:Uncharacterized protein n=1 Tax=Panicum miliaceum TaxID=4540 RepID=A0A3L6Q1K1_PANMI|nr:hypothetical protein C2845_PM17G09280 [Panicum miliaceum]
MNSDKANRVAREQLADVTNTHHAGPSREDDDQDSEWLHRSDNFIRNPYVGQEIISPESGNNLSQNDISIIQEGSSAPKHSVGPVSQSQPSTAGKNSNNQELETPASMVEDGNIFGFSFTPNHMA